MTRLPMVAADTSERDTADIFRFVEGAIGRLPNLYRTLANSPAMLQAWIDFAWTLRSRCSADRAIRELAIMRVAQLTEADYEWKAHWAMSIEAGIPVEKLLTLDHWRDAEGFAEVDRALLALTDEITATGHVSDETWRQFKRYFPDKEAVEIVLTISFYSCVSRVLLALDVPLEQPELRI